MDHNESNDGDKNDGVDGKSDDSGETHQPTKHENQRI